MTRARVYSDDSRAAKGVSDQLIGRIRGIPPSDGEMISLFSPAARGFQRLETFVRQVGSPSRSDERLGDDPLGIPNTLGLRTTLVSLLCHDGRLILLCSNLLLASQLLLHRNPDRIRRIDAA